MECLNVRATSNALYGSIKLTEKELEENGKNYISLVDVAEKKIEKIEISARIPPGFHSIHYYV